MSGHRRLHLTAATPVPAPTPAPPYEPPREGFRQPTDGSRWRLATITRSRRRPSGRVLGWSAGGVLVVLSAVLRLRQFDAGFWIDDGISVGIASHPLREIPTVLRQDGSPPLYYGLLHGWLALFGNSAPAAYALSLIFALISIPVAWWAGRSLFDARTGWICAVLAATSPFLTLFSGQARMYTLVVLLSLVAAAAFAHAFVLRRRALLPVFALALTLLLYTHGWGLFFGVGCAVAVAPCWWLRSGVERRRLLKDAVLTFGAAGLAFAPWLPVLAYQVAHTAAPWSLAPSRAELLRITGYVLGAAIIGPFTLAAAAGLAGERRRRHPERLMVALVLLTVAAVTLFVGWKVGRLTHTWAPRYVAVGVGPAVLVAGAGLAGAGRLGILCLLVTAPGWLPLGPTTISDKSNVAQALMRTEVHPRPDDLVLVTQPELLPVVRYYLGGTPRYASTLGAVPDAQVMDWRDGLERLRHTPASTLTPLLDRVPPGGRVVVVRPKGAPDQIAWQQLIHLRTRQWLRVLRDDGRFRPVFRTARGYRTARLNLVSVLVAERRRDG
ncbi:MAG: glycosyltransferase family 39 protein [Solirubrobacteraceae bacterium]